MTAILLALAPVVIKLFDLWLGKIQADKEARKMFLKLVGQIGKQGLVSVELRQNYYQQLKDLENHEVNEDENK